MDINKFTEKSREALAAAQSLASELKHQQLAALVILFDR